MKKPYLPKFFYEMLPWFYAMMGVLGLYLTKGNALGLISGLVILAAAGTIWCMRRNHRFGLRREEMFRRLRAFKLRQEKCDQDESYRKCHRCDPEFSQRCDRPWATRGKAGQTRRKQYV